MYNWYYWVEYVCKLIYFGGFYELDKIQQSICTKMLESMTKGFLSIDKVSRLSRLSGGRKTLKLYFFWTVWNNLCKDLCSNEFYKLKKKIDDKFLIVSENAVRFRFILASLFSNKCCLQKHSIDFI